MGYGGGVAAQRVGMLEKDPLVGGKTGASGKRRRGFWWVVEVDGLGGRVGE